MHRLVRTLEFHRHLSSIFLSSPAPKCLRSHPTVRSLGAAFAVVHLNHTQSLYFSAYSKPSHRRHHQHHQLNNEYVGVEPNSSHSSSAALSAGGGGGGRWKENIVNVDDGRVAYAITFEEESAAAGGRSGQESHQSVLVSGDGQRTEFERKLLPEELARSANVMKLTCESTAEGGVCDVYLVGTSHVSSKSCQEVQAVISFLKPQVVFLALCSSRVHGLKPYNVEVPTMQRMVEMWMKNENPIDIFYKWFSKKAESKLKVFPGDEFRVAFGEAMKYGGKVVLGDRPKEIKKKDDVEKSTRVDQDIFKKFPTLGVTVLHERDKYMSSSLLKVASEHNLVVAVVGKRHLPGIKNNWKEPIKVKELLTIPTQKSAVSVGKILTVVGAAVAGVAIVSGIDLSS